MQENLFKLLEKLWLAGAGIGVICCVYFLTQKDNDSALFFFGFFILSSVIYILRRKQRIKHQEYLDQKKKAGK
jgi:uncharacterized membrane protein YfcA